MRNPRTLRTRLVKRQLTHFCRDTWGFSTIASRWVVCLGVGVNTVNSTLKVSKFYHVANPGFDFIQCVHNVVMVVVCYKMGLATHSPFYAVYWFQLRCRRNANEISFSATRVVYVMFRMESSSGNPELMTSFVRNIVFADPQSGREIGIACDLWGFCHRWRNGYVIRGRSSDFREVSGISTRLWSGRSYAVVSKAHQPLPRFKIG